MSNLLAACGGFLLAVLWFDLMFDVQTLAHPRQEVLPEAVLASIAAYYRRVTIDAFPMDRAVAGAMLLAIAGSAWQLWTGAVPRWHAALGLLLVLLPVSLAAARIVPAAQRLGRRTDPVEIQSRLAHGICRDHLACFASIACFVALQILAA